MITAHQAEIIALLTDGGVIHRDHLPDDIREQAQALFKQAREDDPYGSDWRYWQILEDEFGYMALSRFSIHEWESVNYSEAVYSGDMDEDDYDDDDPHTWVLCDECMERID